MNESVTSKLDGEVVVRLTKISSAKAVKRMGLALKKKRNDDSQAARFLC